MIPQPIIDKILEIDIIDIVSKYIETKKKGANYTACCPFHNEKTPSLMISPAKGIYKCFGCGESGNAIGFVMKVNNQSFVEAVKEIAQKFSIEIPKEKEISDKEKREYEHKEALFNTNLVVARYFEDSFKSSKEATDYALGRWNTETIEKEGIGYAPNHWQGLVDWAKKQGIKTEYLEELGLIKEGKNGMFDFFRGRLIFPIHNKVGRIIGFIGRDLTGDKEAPKYLNSVESKIYEKSSSLYGIHTAYRKIKETKQAYLVEGNPDVVRMQNIGIHNTVATCGTSLTFKHVQELKNICRTITIIGDNDKAGQIAVERSAEIIMMEGLNCNVITLPEGDEKVDPDSFFNEENQFLQYQDKNLTSYPIFKAVKNKKIAENNAEFKFAVIKDICQILAHQKEKAIREIYIEQLSKIIKPKSAWQDQLNSVLEDINSEEEVKKELPKNIDMESFEKYGFYVDENCYYFSGKDGQHRASNFTLEPLFHIPSTVSAKRLFKMTNYAGFSQYVEFDQKDLISLSAFKLRVESLGNFLWQSNEIDLGKLKMFLYEKTKVCKLVEQMGWQKEGGFYAWCNGIYDGENFIQINNYGIIKINEQYWYIPALSELNKNDEGLYTQEKKFIHKEREISLRDYSELFIKVHGDNAPFGLAFYIATLFRDIIFRHHNSFPILNLFGPKGTGKSEMALSLLKFFGANQEKGPNIVSATKPALADHAASSSNAIIGFEEYKNIIEPEKIEFFKGLYDGTGRTRMNMDKDKKKETTKVSGGIMICGQEMPTADIALYSRVLFLAFHKNQYNEIEKGNFKILKEIRDKGLTHITNEILRHRNFFKSEYKQSFETVSRDLNKLTTNDNIEARIFQNWAVICAAFHVLQHKINIAINYNELIGQAALKMCEQNKETKKGSEVNTFWNIVEYLYNSLEIEELIDYRIEFVDKLKTDIMNAKFSEPRNIIFIRHTRIFQLYRKQGNITKEKVLNTDTLEHYLSKSKAYMGKKKSVSFRRKGDFENFLNGAQNKRDITIAMAFDYDFLQNEFNINLSAGCNDEFEKEMQDSRIQGIQPATAVYAEQDNLPK